MQEIEAFYAAQGFRHIAGVDEAGRGCLAGPVVAAAVILPDGCYLPGVDDSKKLSAKQRELALARIEEVALAIGVGACSPEEIDRLNILHAAMESMRRAVEALTLRPDLLLVDGDRCFPAPSCEAVTLVGGDARSQRIAAASIVAKVTRDRLMRDLDADFPAYGWKGNAGYPTKAHYEALAAHGPSVWHRRSFRLS